jgi:acyl-CoA thioesterase FadM
MPRITRLARRLDLDGSRFAAYASLLEEAATLASAEAGYPAAWYAEHGTAWVIRRSTIECPAPIAAGVDLEIATWVADFRRVRSRREYEVHLAEGGTPVLVAHTDWVYVERAAGRPRRIPPEMIQAFVPEGAPEALERPPFEIPEPGLDAVTMERVATAADVDALGHVNNARYVEYVEASVRAALGGRPRARRLDVEYLAEALGGDRLACTSWSIAASDAEVDAATEIRRAREGTLLTRARGVWISDPTRSSDKHRGR